MSARSSRFIAGIIIARSFAISAASALASAIEIERRRDRNEDVDAEVQTRRAPTRDAAAPTHVRFFTVDGSTFIDGDFVIKGVAGRMLWSLLSHYDREARVEFTNKEMRLDPSLELPEIKDNFESRLILLKRRLDEREAPIRIEKTGRGRFRLILDRPVRLDAVG